MKGFWVGLVALALPLATVGCLIDIDYGGTSFQCDDGRCQAGFVCVAQQCVPDGTGGPDGGTADASADGGPIAPSLPRFQTPQPIPGLTAAGFSNDDMTFRSDRLEVLFNSNRDGGGNLYSSRRTSTAETFSPPTLIAELSSVDNESTLAMTGDGLHVIFGSSRAGGMGGVDVWTSSRPAIGMPWSAPLNVTELNTVDNDAASFLSDDRLTVLVHSNRAGAADIYMATRATVADPFGPLVRIEEVSTPTANQESARLLRGGLVITFGNHEGNGPGPPDLYYASRATLSEPFGAPVLIDGINTMRDEQDAWVSEDLCYIAFAGVDPMTGDQTLYEAVCVTP